MTYISAQRGARTARARFAEQLRRVAGRQVVLVRARRAAVDGPWIVEAYDAQFARLLLSRAAVAELGRVLEAARPDLSWIRGHDYDLGTAMWRSSPRPEEPGADPEADHTFGGTAPVFLPYTVTTPVTAPKDVAA